MKHFASHTDLSEKDRGTPSGRFIRSSPFHAIVFQHALLNVDCDYRV